MIADLKSEFITGIKPTWSDGELGESSDPRPTFVLPSRQAYLRSFFLFSKGLVIGGAPSLLYDPSSGLAGKKQMAETQAQ